MIEEIIKPDTWIYTLIVLIVWIATVPIAWKISDRYNGSFIPIIIWGIIGISFIITSGLIVNNTHDLWEEQVNEQVRGLECDQLEEAYNIYKLESIKERFVFDCLGQKEP